VKIKRRKMVEPEVSAVDMDKIKQTSGAASDACVKDCSGNISTETKSKKKHKKKRRVMAK
jgi:hypothetical protein